MNNDRFKFRVWDNNKNEYVSPFVFINYHGELCANETRWFYPGHENCIIEQCTGLRDRDGKLIYEGDLVVLDGNHPLRVMWHFCEWSLFCDGYACKCNSWEELEIIGNIHETEVKNA